MLSEPRWFYLLRECTRPVTILYLILRIASQFFKKRWDVVGSQEYTARDRRRAEAGKYLLWESGLSFFLITGTQQENSRSQNLISMRATWPSPLAGQKRILELSRLVHFSVSNLLQALLLSGKQVQSISWTQIQDLHILLCKNCIPIKICFSKSHKAVIEPVK